MWNGTEEKFILSIKDINDKGDRFSITFTGDEELVGTYYLNDIEEKEYLSDILKIGTEVLVKGTLTKPLNNTIPNNFNYKSYLNNKDIYYQLKIESIEVIKDSSNVIDIIKNWILKRIDKIDNTGYMRAFVLGDNSLIDDKIYEIYQEIGVTHLFALSGSQVVLLSLVILRFLKIFKTKIRYIIAISFIIVYGFIVGYPASIKRAIVFFIIASINKLEVINLSNIKILFLTVVVLILSNYKIIYDIAFLYSVLTVFGIFLAKEFIDDKNKFKSSFKLSIVAFLFSLPITLYNFYEL
ncbi:MAG TPA: ComEC/Rec2 family competence protein, partial [Candidatus Coprovivens excrementavium]|nr:ComEC/Rec2 family competence protein [Candidatus Coprovivens excrementavium]